MKKLLTLTLVLATLALMETKVMNQTQTIFLKTSYNQASQRALPANFQSSGCTPPPSGLVSWWPGNGNANDIIGGKNGTLLGGVSYAPGKVNQAFSFPSLGSSGSDRVGLSSGPSANAFTIEAWVFANQHSPSGYRTIYADNFRGFWLKSGKLNWWRGGARFVGNTTVPLGAWHHIALTYSQGTFTGYLNGAADGTSSFPGESLPTGTGLGIGGHSNALSEDFDGLIDELAVYDRALYAAEIQAIFNAGSAGKCSIPQKKGMTWAHTASNAQYGTITVGCNGCDAKNGDTLCSQQLPVLCIYKPTPAFQLPVGLPVPDQNNRWAGGIVATTLPVAGNTFANSAAVSAYCQTRFGTGWRVAEFHDGWGWNFQAYGGTVSAPTVPSTRFWVHINDQKDGNCWQP